MEGSQQHSSMRQQQQRAARLQQIKQPTKPHQKIKKEFFFFFFVKPVICVRFYLIFRMKTEDIYMHARVETLTIPQGNLVLSWVVEHHTVEVPLLGVLDNSLKISTTQRGKKIVNKLIKRKGLC